MTNYAIKFVTTLLLLAISMVFLASKAGEVGKTNRNVPFSSNGSFAIAVVYRDGILIGADSRGTISDSTGRKLAFWDGVQKVFPIRQAALAYTGQETIKNIFFGAIVHSFAQTVPEDIPLEDIIPSFLEYTDTILPREVSELVRDQHLIIAGFSEGKANACYYNAKQTDGPKMACGLGLVSSDQTIIDEQKKELRFMDEQIVEKLIRKAIPLYAKDKNTKDIGGPIYIRAISKNNNRWLGKAPTPTPWTYIDEFAKSYWTGEIKLHLLPGVTKEELEATIRLGEDWSRNARQKH